MLFAEPSQPRTSPLGRTEPAAHWYTESTRTEAIDSRRAVNEWYSEFSDPQGALTNRLHSDLDVDHYQAVDELFTHHLLRTRHADVRYEEGGTGPDFRVYDSEGLVAGVEVLSLFQPRDWSDEERLHARLADQLDERLRPSAGYFVDFSIEAAPSEPAPGHVARFVERQLSRLPPHDSLNLPQGVRRHDLPQANYERNGVRITMTFIPMAKGAAAKTDPDARIVGTGAIIGGLVTTGLRLKDRVEQKAGGRYDVGKSPLVVAAFVHDTFNSEDETLRALYGSETAPLGDGAITRKSDGVFGVDETSPRGRQRRLAAVAVVSGLLPWSVGAADVAVYLNPHSDRPYPNGLIPANRVVRP